MSTSKNIQISGFPDVWGGRSRAIPVDHYGPVSYPSGGEVFPAQSVYGGPNSLGLAGVYWCNGGVTEDGLYLVVPVFGGAGAVKGTIKLIWYDLAASTGGTFSGDAATLTGSVAAPDFTGDEATLTGTNAAPTVTTVDDSGSPTLTLGELEGALSTNGVLTGLTGVQAPALTMTPYTPTGTNSAPDLTMDSYTPTGTIVGGSGGGFVEIRGGVDLSASFLRILVIGG